MTYDLSSLSKDISTLKKGIDTYIVQPLNDFGIGGFVFDVERETTMQLQADITDHYVEDNTAVQDHIARKPLRVTLTGYVGELVYPGNKKTYTYQKVAQKLTLVSDFLPTLSSAATQAKSILDGTSTNFTTAENTISNLWAAVKNSNPTATAQQQAYLYFEALYNQGILVSLQTPFKFIQKMAIESITARQGEESKDISDFSITLKQIRYAAVTTVAFDASQFQGRAGDQSAPMLDKGHTGGENKSIAASLWDSYWGNYK